MFGQYLDRKIEYLTFEILQSPLIMESVFV